MSNATKEAVSVLLDKLEEVAAGESDLLKERLAQYKLSATLLADEASKGMHSLEDVLRLSDRIASTVALDAITTIQRVNRERLTHLMNAVGALLPAIRVIASGL